MDETEPGKSTSPRVIAISGPIAAGKDELANYLVENHDAAAIEVGAFARYLSKETNSEELRPQYDGLFNKLGEYDTAYVLQRLVDEIIETGEQIPRTLVITGVRTPAEAAFLKAHFGSDLLLVYVKVSDRRVRYERVLTRRFATDPDNFQGFVELDEQMKIDNALEETAKWADIVLWNDGALEDYHQQIETEVIHYLKE